MLRTGTDVDRNQDYPPICSVSNCIFGFRCRIFINPGVFRVARYSISSSSIVVSHCMRARECWYNIELVISRYRLIIGTGAKFSSAGVRYASVSPVCYLWPRFDEIHGRGIALRTLVALRFSPSMEKKKRKKKKNGHARKWKTHGACDSSGRVILRRVYVHV